MTYDTDDDHATFEKAMEDVAPLGQRSKSARSGHPLKAPPVTSKPSFSSPGLQVDLRRVSPIAGDLILDWKRAGLLNKEYHKLCTGRLTPSPKEFDLHGLHMHEVVEQIHQAIFETHQARRHSLCLVHGKGLRSGTGDSLAKGVVVAVLRTHPEVMGFHSVPRNTGAVNVLLRRPR